ncbi:MAG: hypothetical protein NC388_00900 [Clostridium sp.]|nr:hypothetical protein [Clostridium sp.]
MGYEFGFKVSAFWGICQPFSGKSFLFNDRNVEKRFLGCLLDEKYKKTDLDKKKDSKP